MRLIDLNERVFVPIVDEALDTSYEEQMTLEEVFENFFEGNIPPVVNAIPIEWLRNVQAKYALETEPVPMYVAIGLMIDMWRKEQEAR